MGLDFGAELTSSAGATNPAHILDTDRDHTADSLLSVREDGSEVWSVRHDGAAVPTRHLETVVVTGDDTSRTTRATAVQNAINDAVGDSKPFVLVPDNFTNYDASLVTFDNSVRMVREGQITDVYDVKAYGAVGDGSTDDEAAVKAWLDAATGGARAYAPPGNYNLPSWTEYAPSGDLRVEGASRDTVTFTGPGVGSDDFLRAGTPNLVVSDFKVDGFDDVVFLGSSSSSGDFTERITIRRLWGTNCTTFYSDSGSSSVGDLGVLELIECWGDGLAVNGIEARSPSWEMVRCIGNVIENISSSGRAAGISLGDNDTSGTRKMTVVSGNRIESSTSSSGSAEVKGIIVYGERASITDNHIESVTGSGGDTEGIYTKCKWSRIANNTLVDAGDANGQGSIIQKGTDRSGSGNGPDGFAVGVVNNVVRFTTLDRDQDGITATTDDTAIVGNMIDNAGTAINVTAPQCTVHGNVIRSMVAGVKMGVSADGCTIVGNTFSELGDSSAPSNQGVIVRTTGTALPVIVGNHFTSVDSGASNRWWIWADLASSGEGLIIADNSFHDGDKGLHVDTAANVVAPRVRDNVFIGVSDPISAAFESAPRLVLNGLGIESANAEEPTASDWEPGDVVDFTDSGDGSGTGIYILAQDGVTWKQLA